MIFKKGDKVRCINKRLNPTSDLKIGKIYTVKTDETYGDMQILGLQGVWTASQFELAKTARKAKPKVYGIVKFLKSLERRTK